MKATCTWRTFAAVALFAMPVSALAQTPDDLGTILTPDGPAKKTAPAKTPPAKRTPAKEPPKARAKTPAKTPVSPPAKKLRAAPSTVPGEEPGAKPIGANGGRKTRRAGGIMVAGNHYPSLDEYMFGIWRWRNNKGQLMHLSFFRNKTFLAFNTSTQVRVFGRFWTVANRHMHINVTRVCRFNQCRPPPRQVRRSFPTYPVSANVVRNGNERWTRIRRH